MVVDLNVALRLFNSDVISGYFMYCDPVVVRGKNVLLNKLLNG